MDSKAGPPPPGNFSLLFLECARLIITVCRTHVPIPGSEAFCQGFNAESPPPGTAPIIRRSPGG